jgi:hypothetical protein
MKRFRSRSGGVFSYLRIHENVLHFFGVEPSRGSGPQKRGMRNQMPRSSSILFRAFQAKYSKYLISSSAHHYCVGGCDLILCLRRVDADAGHQRGDDDCQQATTTHKMNGSSLLD